jgi:hypothetical protein
VVPLIIGAGRASLWHVMIPVVATRLYLLERLGGTLAIEVNDVSGGDHLDRYSAIVEAIDFGD